MKVTLLIVLAGLAYPMCAAAGFISGEQLLQDCRSFTPDRRSYCIAYIAGVADSMQQHALFGWRSCIVEGARREQLRELVVQRLIEKPQERGLTAASIVAEALSAAFPCPPR
jgi:Rap1a immunity proteins